MKKSLNSKNLKQNSQINHLEEINFLLKKNQNNQFLKTAINLHNSYYSAVKKDLTDLAEIVFNKNKKIFFNPVRKLNQDKIKEAEKKLVNQATKKMKSDLSLMNEVKDYLQNISFDDQDNRFIRFAFNKTSLIIEKSIEKIADENFFSDLISKNFLAKFDFQNITFFAQKKHQSQTSNQQYFKGSLDISVISCCLFYLLESEDLNKEIKSKNSLIYLEKITEILAKNSQLAKKIRSNYHLFIKNDDALAKIYEAYEFGGDKDLENFYHSKFLPLDCSTAIAKLLNIKKNQFSTYHLASYFNEYFFQGAVYWSAQDQKIRKELVKKITPKKISNLKDLKPSEIIAWRSFDENQNIENPCNYLGKSGHVGIILGVKDNFIYYLSYLRDLEGEEKCGVGIDIIDINQASENQLTNKKIFYLFTANL